MPEIEIGKRYQLSDPDNRYHGIILTVARIEDNIVRFKDAPFGGYGAGIAYFSLHYHRVDDADH